MFTFGSMTLCNLVCQWTVVVITCICSYCSFWLSCKWALWGSLWWSRRFTVMLHWVCLQRSHWLSVWWWWWRGLRLLCWNETTCQLSFARSIGSWHFVATVRSMIITKMQYQHLHGTFVPVTQACSPCWPKKVTWSKLMWNQTGKSLADFPTRERKPCIATKLFGNGRGLPFLKWVSNSRKWARMESFNVNPALDRVEVYWGSSTSNVELWLLILRANPVTLIHGLWAGSLALTGNNFKILARLVEFYQRQKNIGTHPYNIPNQVIFRGFQGVSNLHYWHPRLRLRNLGNTVSTYCI